MNQDNINPETDRVTHPNWGGARVGAGRPKGTGNKIKIEDLIDSIELRAGVPFADQIAANYVGAIGRSDWARVENYDRALLNKIVADKNDITIDDSSDTIASKQAAFAAALAALTTRSITD